MRGHRDSGAREGREEGERGAERLSSPAPVECWFGVKEGKDRLPVGQNIGKQKCRALLPPSYQSINQTRKQQIP